MNFNMANRCRMSKKNKIIEYISSLLQTKNQYNTIIVHNFISNLK